MYAVGVAGPKAGRMDARIVNFRLVEASWFDPPDVGAVLAAIFGELAAALRFLPCLTEVIAVAQKCAEEVTVIGSEQALALALIEDGIENASAFQRRGLDFPCFSIF